MKNIYITGYPNSGKTTLFNALTNSQAMVGNWSGVTVEVESATLQAKSSTVPVYDIPGLYSLMDRPANQDEALARQTIMTAIDAIYIQVIDASQLERQLFLTLELLDLNQPLIIVINQIELAKKHGLNINIEKISSILACPVLVYDLNHPTDLISKIEVLTQTILSKSYQQTNISTPFTPEVESLIQTQQINHQINRMHAIEKIIQQDTNDDLNLDLDIADARYSYAHKIMQTCTHSIQQEQEDITSAIDRIVLHRTFGLPLFFIMIYGLFFIVMKIGGFLQNLFDLFSHSFFVQLPGEWLTQHHAPQFFIHLIADGLGQGLNTTCTFIPVLGMMYIGLSLLEGSGYMARIAYLMDRLMRYLGLPGKAFVPLLIGFGCNVPAILATRTLDHPRDRILTSLMLPFMSCSARLTLFTALVSAFFPQHGYNIIFILYVVGIIIAIGCGWIVQHTLLPSEPSPLILELPMYQRPEMKRIIKIAFYRLKHFVIRATFWILPMCMLISVLNQLTFHDQSYLSWLGKTLTPLFTPIGLTEDNWPATVGLLTGLLAKEVVMGTLNTLYQQMSTLIPSQDAYNFHSSFVQAWQTLLHPWSSLTPVLETDNFNHQTRQTLQQAFHGAANLYAYLTFLLLYLPCISTMAAIKQETSAQWMWLSMIGSLVIAYVTAAGTYWVFSNTWDNTQIMWTLAALSIIIFIFWKYWKYKTNQSTLVNQEESHAV